MNDRSTQQNTSDWTPKRSPSGEKDDEHAGEKTGKQASAPRSSSNAPGDDVASAAASATATPPVFPPRYQVQQQFDAGGFGLVFIAVDAQLGRQVVLKVARQSAGPQSEIDDAMNEARVVAQLDHPGIVKIFDVGQTEDGRPFLVCQYIQGVNLATRLEQSRLPHREAARIAAAIAEALDFAHQKGVVHRDIKPANILLDGVGTPFVADFGLALTHEKLGSGTGSAGTPHYMSPEQAIGEGHLVSGSSDIFSLGAVLYEMLTGRRPFPGQSLSETIELVRRAHPWPPRQLDSHVPEQLERICLKALAKVPAARYATAGEMARDLAGFLATTADKPSPAVPPRGRTKPLGPLGQRSLKSLPAELVAALLAGAGLCLMLVLWLASLLFSTSSEPKDSSTVLSQRPGYNVGGGSVPSNFPSAAEAEESPTSAWQQPPSPSPLSTIPATPIDNLGSTGFGSEPDNSNRRPPVSVQFPPGLGGSPLFGNGGLGNGGFGGPANATDADDDATVAAPADVQPEFSLIGHTGPIRCIKFAHGGGLIATGGDDQTVRFWDAATGKVRGVARGYPAAIRCVAITPTGDAAAFAGDGYGNPLVVVWDLQANAELNRSTWRDNISPSRVHALAFSPDGKLLAACGTGPVRVWDWRAQLEPKILNWQETFPSYAYDLAFDPTGKLLAIGCHGGGMPDRQDTVRLFDPRKGEAGDILIVPSQARGLSHSDVQGAIAFSSDGRALARVSQASGNIGFGMVTARSNVAAWRVGEWASPELKDLPVGKAFALLIRAKDEMLIACAAGSADAYTIPNATTPPPPDRVFLWRPAGAVALATGHKGRVTAVAFSPDGALLATGGDDNSIKVWSVAKVAGR
jgi:serine/threonine protein kinase/WD40 repeat protein